MRNRRGLRFDDHLNVALAENPFFRALFEVTSGVVSGGFEEQLAQLSRLRSALHIGRGDWITENGVQLQVAQVAFRFDDAGVYTELTATDARGQVHTVVRRAIHDRAVLVDSARQLGFDYYSDTISNMSYVQIIESLAEFWPTNGSTHMIDFIGFIKQTRLSSNQLWADDSDPQDEYVTLEPRSDTMRSVVDGGTAYPTSHYEVLYDALSNPSVDLADLVKLFYVFAPINFVLHRLVGYVEDVPINVRTVVQSYCGVWESATLSVGAHGTTQKAVVARTALGVWESGVYAPPLRVQQHNFVASRNAPWQWALMLTDRGAPLNLAGAEVVMRLRQNNRQLVLSVANGRLYLPYDNVLAGYVGATALAALQGAYTYTLEATVSDSIVLLLRGQVTFGP